MTVEGSWASIRGPAIIIGLKRKIDAVYNGVKVNWGGPILTLGYMEHITVFSHTVTSPLHHQCNSTGMEVLKQNSKCSYVAEMYVRLCPPSPLQ